MFLFPVTHLEIEGLIVNFNSSKSIGPHSVRINILKIFKQHISHPLAVFVNESFLKGTFSNKLKVAKVVLVSKQKDPEIRCNYKPISLLLIFSKIFEKLIYKRLNSFVACNKMIYPLQFGFQEHHSLAHALASMTETIRSLDNNKYGLWCIY